MRNFGDNWFGWYFIIVAVGLMATLIISAITGNCS